MHSTRPSPEILQRVQLIIRRDLKLGADVQIPPDMPFFGGDVDLDSLDILLLVTSIEKEFGVKIPSDQVGKEVFENVATLASYVEKTVGCGGNAAPKPAAADATGGDPLERLPHGPEFRFITRLTSAKPGEEATGVWEVSGEEPFFKGHFPGNPLVPGVLLTEALAQLSGLAALRPARVVCWRRQICGFSVPLHRRRRLRCVQRWHVCLASFSSSRFAHPWEIRSSHREPSRCIDRNNGWPI